MKKEIEDFIKSCDTCQRQKIANVKQYGMISLKDVQFYFSLLN